MRMGLHTAEPYFHEDSSTALESTGLYASALRCCKCRWTAARFVADFRRCPECPRCSNRREGATFAAPSRHASDNARQTLGPVGVREMSSTIWAKSFSLPSIAMSACARTPTSVLSSSTTGKRRT